MVSKKILAGVLSTIMCLTSVIVVDSVGEGHIESDFVTPAKEPVKAENGGLTVGSNGLLSNYIDNTIAMQQPTNVDNFSILSGTFDNENGTLRIESSQAVDCTIMVKFFTDDEEKNCICSLNEDVKAGNRVISEISVDKTVLPEFYSIEVSLVGTFKEVLSPVYHINKYTASIQDIISKDIHDFNPEYVVNLDEREDTNFLVLSESTIIAESNDKKNVLVSMDEENGEYVFEQTDEEIEALQPGDNFYIHPENSEAIAIEVENISFEDGKAIITQTDNDEEVFDEMFEFIKIDSLKISDTQVMDMENLDIRIVDDVTQEVESVEYSEETGSYVIAQPNDPVGDVEGNIANSIKFELGAKYDNEEGFRFVPGLKKESSTTTAITSESSSVSTTSTDTSLNGSAVSTTNTDDDIKEEELEVYIGVIVTLDYNIEFYKKKKEIDTSVSVEITASFNGNVSGALQNGKSLEAELKAIETKFSIGIPAVFFEWKPKIIIKFEAELGLKASISNKVGLQFTSKDGSITPIKDCGEFQKDTEVVAEGSCYIGLCLNPRITIISTKVASVGLDVLLGIKGTATVNGSHEDVKKISEIRKELGKKNQSIITNNKVYSFGADYEDTVHLCEGWCSSLDLDFIIECNYEFSVLKDLFAFEGNLFALTFDIGEAYCSYDKGFGWGECSNIAHKVNVHVTKDAASYGDAKATISGINASTDANGNAIFYVKNGKYSCSVGDNATEDRASGALSDTFEIKDCTKNITINLTTDKNNKSSSLVGDGVAFEREEATGPKEINDIPIIPEFPEEHKMVENGMLGDNIAYMIYEDGFMEIIGYGEMYNNNSIKNKSIVTEVLIENLDEENGKVITNIGDGLFSGFTGLTSTDNVEIPDSVTSIGARAFFNTGLIEVNIPNSVKVIGAKAFSGCTKLKTVIIGNGIESIGEHVFISSINIEELTLPFASMEKTVAKSGDGTYSNSVSRMFTNDSKSCYLIKKITITGGETIPSNAFIGLENLEEVIIPETVEKIGSQAFVNCKSLQKLTIFPRTTIFSKTNGLTSLKDVVIHCYTNSDAHKYAESNGIKYVLLDELPATTEPVPPTEPDKPVQPDEITHTYIYGDINNDSSIDLMDLTYLSLHLLGDREIDEITLKYADVCGDNNGVDIADLAFLKQYIMKDPMAILPVSDAA